MKQFYLKGILLCLGLLAGTTTASAYDAKIGDIYYYLSGNVATVTDADNSSGHPGSSYSGNVVIPSTVTYGGKTYSVRSIGYCAFWRCQDLTSVTVPNSVTSIGDFAFADCGSSLASLTIPSSVTSIGRYAFRESGLTSLDISGATSIGEGVFQDCRSLVSVTLSEKLTATSERMFSGCNSLAPFSLPNSLTSIGDFTFYGCWGLTSFTIPNHVTHIGMYAFNACLLTSVTIPGSVTSIGSNAFNYNRGLTAVYIDNISAWCRITFEDYSSNPLLYSFESHLYLNGEEVTDLSIPDGVPSIADYAFFGCEGLTSITLPNSLVSIGEQVFQNCRNLKEIHCRAEETPEVSATAFNNITVSKIPLYVPRDSYQQYKEHPVWGLFDVVIETGISLPSFSEGIAAVYDMSGRQQSSSQRGLNIIRMSDGTTRKVILK